MLVWGIPNTTNNTQVNTSLTWDGCLTACFYSPACVMAWQNDSTCYNYAFYYVDYVSRTTSANESVVAFKVNSPNGTCPTGAIPPTFDNQNATGHLYVNDYPPYFPYHSDYSIYATPTGWKISSRMNHSCIDMTDVIVRADNSMVCLMTFRTSTAGSFSYNRSLELCKSKGVDALFGAVYPEDFEQLAEIGERERNETANRNTYARIDGIRTKACQSTPRTPYCMSPKGFTFLSSVPTFEHYNWVTNSSAMATANDNCLVLVFNGNNAVKVDVKSCEGNFNPLPAQFFVCSRPAWEN
ncbi:PAN-3 domain-containing protein [Caenorhabditis elegans]|uniref:PAN-3 domain-containing protein n=1 Tax=Caenorhabditis elegans TaxID=6239 RepID=Q9N4B3_CAEEL|nr:PAN-3 domain-containing protein [Caenorhabditis elegans]CCD72594.1 PAN-3 domain-containing protein [Caenorhabditis elegans]|eukprot:NP_500080.2 C-type LECtin [Caenorhabditis elegans]